MVRAVIFFIFMGMLFSQSSVAKNIKKTSYESCKPGRIIFITGSCSAGKTSIAKIIAERLDAKYFAFDELVWPATLKKFIAKHYGKLVAWFVSDVVKRNFFSSVDGLSEKTKYKFQKKFLADLQDGLAVKPIIRMYKKAKEAANQGYDVVVESPLFLFEGVNFLESLKVLKDTNITYVLAYCPWDNLVERLEKRNSSTNKKNHRELDWVLGNYVQYVEPSIYHRGQHFLERLHGEQVHNTIAKYAQKQYKTKRMHLLTETQQMVLATFPTQSRYYAYPRFAYDIIINTGTHDPAKGAAMVLR